MLDGCTCAFNMTRTLGWRDLNCLVLEGVSVELYSHSISEHDQHDQHDQHDDQAVQLRDRLSVEKEKERLGCDDVPMRGL